MKISIRERFQSTLGILKKQYGLETPFITLSSCIKSISFADQKTAVHLFFISFFLRKLIIEEGDIPCSNSKQHQPIL